MAFVAGDRVKLVGTVKERVTDKPSGRVSILLGTDDMPGAPSKEYWAEEAHLVAAEETTVPAGTGGTGTTT